MEKFVMSTILRQKTAKSNVTNNSQSAKDFFREKVLEFEAKESGNFALDISVEAKVQNDKHSGGTYIAALTVITAELNLSDRSFRLLSALIGLSRSNRTFKITFKNIYFRLRKLDPKMEKEDGTLKNSALQTVRRYIDALKKDQERTGVLLAKITSGNKDSKKDDALRIPSLVELPLLDYLDEINRRTRANPSYSRNSRHIRDNEARKYAAELLAAAGYQPPSKKTQKPADKIRERLRQTMGMLKSSIELMENEDYTNEAKRKWIVSEMPDSVKALLFNEIPEEELGAMEHRRGQYDSDTYGTNRVSIPNQGFTTDTLQTPKAEQNQQLTGEASVDNLHFDHTDECAPIKEACQMIDAFENVGACHFDVTITDMTEEKVDYQSALTGDALREMLDEMVPACAKECFNIIVRPSADVALIQLDDLDQAAIAKLDGYSFLTIETSPHNFQSWVAVIGADKELIRRLKKGVGADMSASGATRLAGSRNFKTKHSPIFPHIRIVKTSPGLVLSIAELEASGLLAAEEPKPTAPAYAPIAPVSHRWKVFPSYERYLAEAPKARKHDGKDRSHADFMFCLHSIGRGFSVEAAAQQLMSESQKARECGFGYALRTAQHAAEISAKNYDRKRG
jgi:hypothetical protein